MSARISTDKLRRFCVLEEQDEDSLPLWKTFCEPIPRELVTYALEHELIEPECNECTLSWGREERYHNLQRHIRRIAYFVKHPERINAVELWIEDDGRVALSDGFHRYAAACYLEMVEIPFFWTDHEYTYFVGGMMDRERDS